MRAYWHHPQLRATAAVAEGWRLFDEIYRITEWDDAALQRVRADRTRAMNDALRGVPAYSSLPIGDTWEQTLERAPVLVKSDVVARPEDYLTGLVPEEDAVIVSTSGTSGEPLSIWHDESRFVEACASELRVHAAYGVPVGHRRLGFTTDARHGLVHFSEQPLSALESTLRINVALLDADNRDYVDRLVADFAPTVAGGQPLEVLIGLDRVREGLLRLPEDLTVITHGDSLGPATKQAIEEGTGGRHFDIYGLQEFGKIAWECPAEPGRYHVDVEKVHVERTEDGTVCFTSLVNRAMAFLRYAPGDLAETVDRPCPCGRALPTLSGIAGRQRGILVDDDDRPRNIKEVRLLLEGLGAERWQVRQDAPGSMQVTVTDEVSLPGDLLDGLRAASGIAAVHLEQRDLAGLLSARGKAPYFLLFAGQDHYARR